MIRSFILFLFLTPQIAFASIYVSEIAWMGDSESANNEWVEIYSDEGIDLTGWSLAALDGTPSISLESTINGALVLYRGVHYSGALENGGEVLILSDADGTEVFRVDGSDGWSVGGNNETKESAQYVSGNWVTAAPTPGTVTVSESVVKEEVATPTSSYERPYLVISIPDVIDVVAGDEHIFSVEVGNNEGAKYSGALVHWNFGDGSMISGNTIYHRYSFAGNYTAHVSVKYGGEEISKKINVVVREADISFSIVNASKIEVRNGDKKELDISHWRIVDGSNIFMFPAHSYIGEESSIFFSKEITGFPFSPLTKLTYPNGKEVSVSVKENVPAKVVYVPVPKDQEEDLAVEEVEVSKNIAPAATIISQKESGTISIWVHAWVVLVLLVGGSIVYIRKYG